ncbi:uncharacterized protein LOC142568534 [Dermacentor variabilis]|uniref:uncharacterized protein LOC142568534 n=1 Tax=Dermacentor variabilis TaxID=34621 RepID=UPI003F5B2927
MKPKGLTRRQRSNDSVCMKGPRSGRLRESAACLVSSCPSVCRSVNQLFSNTRCVRSILSHHQEDLDKSCTASGTDGCFNLAELSPWNNFLWLVIELRETRLALASMWRRVVALDSNKQRRCPFILVHCPLMEHLSIEFLELREWRMSPKQFQFTDNLIHARLH